MYDLHDGTRVSVVNTKQKRRGNKTLYKLEVLAQTKAVADAESVLAPTEHCTEECDDFGGFVLHADSCPLAQQA